MRRLLYPAPILALVAVLLAVPSARADHPLAGNWKVIMGLGPNEIIVAILTIEDKDGGKPTVTKIAGLPDVFENAKLEDVKLTKSSLNFSIKGSPAGDLDFVTYIPKGEDKPKGLLGSTVFRNNRSLVLLEATQDKEIDKAKGQGPSPALADLRAALTADGKEKEEKLAALIKDHGKRPIAPLIAAQLLQMKIKDEAGDADLKKAADALIQVGRQFGTEVEPIITLDAARALLGSDKCTALGVEYARAADKLLGDAGDKNVTAQVLGVLHKALTKTGKADDAKKVQERLVKVEDELDKEFEKTSIPFNPKPFARSKGDRVAVVELFTGSQCPPCVSADIAFDAAIKAYKPAEAVFLEYHLHIPGPDPMTNPDSVARQKYYGEKIQGTPTAFVSGKETKPLGGFKPDSKDRYATLATTINDAVEGTADAKVQVTAERKGDDVEIKAVVSGLKNPGEKKRLRFVLVEDVVRYQGGNGQRLHHHVVRALPGGADGFALKEADHKEMVKISLKSVREGLADYLKDFSFRGAKPFASTDNPLGLKNLKVIALIQDDDTQEILQAVQVDVPAK